MTNTQFSKGFMPDSNQVASLCIIWTVLVWLAHKPIATMHHVTLGLFVGAMSSVASGNGSPERFVTYEWFEKAKIISLLACWPVFFIVDTFRNHPRAVYLFVQLVVNINVLEAALRAFEIRDYVCGIGMFAIGFVAPGFGVDQSGYLVIYTDGCGLLRDGRLPCLRSARTYFRLHFTFLLTWYLTSTWSANCLVYFAVSCIIPMVIMEALMKPPYTLVSTNPVVNAEAKGADNSLFTASIKSERRSTGMLVGDLPEAELRDARLLGKAMTVRIGALVWLVIIGMWLDPDVTEYSTRLMVPQPRGGYPDPYLDGEEDTPAIVLKRNMAQAAIVAVCIIIFAVNDRRVAGVSR